MPYRDAALRAQALQRATEVRDQVVGVLEADRDAQQVRRGDGRRAFHRMAMLDERLGAAKARSAREEREATRELECRVLAALERDAHHAAEAAAHLARGNC